jgi:hypothetical protein
MIAFAFLCADHETKPILPFLINSRQRQLQKRV